MYWCPHIGRSVRGARPERTPAASRTRWRVRVAHVSVVAMLSPAARKALDDLVASDDPTILGLVLSGSAARGMATDLSDVDVYVVRDDAMEWESTRSAMIDAISWSVADLEQVDRHGTGGWYFRWSFAYAQVLRDLTGGRITEAVRRQATVDDDEQRWVLIDQERLDGYVNFAYRALKNHRDGRLLEARLDACESVSWLLHVMFTLAGRLRPYNKYLPWEMRTHPLGVSEWSAEMFMPELERTMAGDPDAIRRTFAVVEREVRAWDAAHDTTVCGDVVDSWGEELALFAAV